jgi:hypothetical protein
VFKRAALDDLQPIEVRIVFGMVHADKLGEDIEKFKRSGIRPYRIEHEADGDDWFKGFIRIARHPPIHLGVTAGEAVSQYVHALDNLMTAMVRLNGDPKARAYWPYVSDPKAKTLAEAKALVRPEHYAIIEREQPYNTAPRPVEEWTVRDYVVAIHRMANHDKHEAVHSGFVVPTFVGVAQDPSILDFEMLYKPMEPLSNGLLIYRVRYENRYIHTIALVFEPDVAFEADGAAWMGPDEMKHCGEIMLDLVEEVRLATPEWRLPGIEEQVSRRRRRSSPGDVADASGRG